MDVQPSKPASRGPEDWFTGDVWIDSIASGQEPSPLSLGNVHFTPGARTAWHSHSIAQTLYVTEGEGLVQSRAARPSSRSVPATSSTSLARSGTGTAPPPTTS